MPALEEETVFESNMMKLALDRSVDPKFGEIVLLSSFAGRHFVARAKKAVQQASINQQDIAALPFPLPPLIEQETIVIMEQSLRNQIEMYRFESRALRDAKHTMADVLLTGRARVSL